MLKNIPAERLAKYKNIIIEEVWEDFIELNDALIYGIQNPGGEEEKNIFAFIEELEVLYHVLKFRIYHEKQGLLKLLDEYAEMAVNYDEEESYISEKNYFQHEFLPENKRFTFYPDEED